MRREQLKVGAKVYQLKTGDLYELIAGSDGCWIREHIGRRGERSNRAGTAAEWLLTDFVLWCERCDGKGYVCSVDREEDTCPKCNGNGVIY